jgi:hypothetical protein
MTERLRWEPWAGSQTLPRSGSAGQSPASPSRLRWEPWAGSQTLPRSGSAGQSPASPSRLRWEPWAGSQTLPRSGSAGQSPASPSRLAACAGLSLALVAVSACAPAFTERMPTAPVRRAEPLVTVPVVLAPATDLRPEVLKEFHDPVRARLFNAFWVFGSHFAYAYDGPLLYGDAHTRLTTSTDPKKGLPPMAALDTYLPMVLGAAIGGEIARAPTSSGPDAMRDPARLLPDGNGIVVVPAVDQMDVCKLSSETHRHDTSTRIERRYDWDRPESRGNGDGWGQVHPVFPFPGQNVAGTHLEETTTMSASGGISDTRPIGNVRVRLLLFRIDAGRVVARSTVYAAGAGNGLAAAMAGAGLTMAKGVADFLTQSGATGARASGK